MTCPCGWQTVCARVALEHLTANGYPLDPRRRGPAYPLGHPTINLDGRYCGRTQIRANTLMLLAALAERRAAGQESDRMARVRRWLCEVLAEYRRHRGRLPRACR